MKNCINCDLDISKKRNSKYCSNKCQVDYEWKITKKKIERGDIIIINAQRNLRKYFLEKYENKCSICKNIEWIGRPIALILDHINGNSDDYSLINLRLICPNCDAQTETYKGKNRGNGRHIRRKRYKEGKSY